MIVNVLSPRGRFEPLAADHPAVGQPCIGCGKLLEPGQPPSLVNGVPADADEQASADAGRAHTVQAQLAHESCAFPE